MSVMLGMVVSISEFFSTQRRAASSAPSRLKVLYSLIAGLGVAEAAGHHLHGHYALARRVRRGMIAGRAFGPC